MKTQKYFKKEIQLALKGKIIRMSEDQYRKLMLLSLGDDEEIKKYSLEIYDIENKINGLISKRDRIYQSIESRTNSNMRKYSKTLKSLCSKT